MNVIPSIDILGAGTGAITRAGTGTYYDSTGTLQTAAANVLRLSYDPANLGAAPTPLIEAAATNFWTNSEDAANWIKNGATTTVSANAALAPDGSTTADVVTTQGYGYGLYKIFGLTQGTTYTASVHVKKLSGAATMFRWGSDSDGTTNYLGLFDALSGTARSIGANLKKAYVEPCGDYGLRLVVTFEAWASAPVAFVLYPDDGDMAYSVWGAQLVVGDKPGSYIANATNGSVTRPADVITGSGLVYSSAIDTAPAAWAGGTTYAQGATVSVAGLLGALDCYASLQNGNTGHAPASSPLYWAYAGTTYPPYAGGATFASYARCLDAVNHLVYESLVDGNTGNALADGTKWKEVGYSNRYAAFDRLRNTRTVGANPLVMLVKPGQRINALALVGVKATSATITMINGADTVFSVTRDLNTRDATDGYKYCFEPFSNQEEVTLYDLPPYYDGLIAISLVNAFGAAECGGVFMGTYTYIGAIQYEAESDALNFSTVTRDSEGNAEMQAERNVPKLIGQIILDKKLVRAVYDLRDQLNGTTAVWDGLADDTDGYAKPFFIQGFYRRFTINVKYPNEAVISLELEEV